MRTDVQIQKDVMAQIQWDPFLNTGNIGVSVRDGVVTLSGDVDSYARKQAAETAAKKILGVRAVAEEIKVGPSPTYERTDSDIARAVATALAWHSAVQEDRIKIKVEKGVVTLDGEVEWNYQRTAAADAIRNLNGVKWVNNAVIVKPAVMAGDVKKKIKDAMARNVSLDADKISVDILGNKVVLRGTVRSLAEREDAEYAAWSAPGVTVVDDKLTVEVPALAY